MGEQLEESSGGILSFFVGLIFAILAEFVWILLGGIVGLVAPFLTVYAIQKHPNGVGTCLCLR